MRIVLNTKDRLEIEHKSWAVSMISLAIYALLAWVVWIDGALESYFLVALPTLYLWFLYETCRITFDRNLGTVRVFQKTMRQTRRQELQMSQLLGAFVESQRRRNASYTLHLGFEKDGQRWHIPTHLYPFLRKSKADAMCVAINVWHNVSTADVKVHFPDPRRRLH